MRCARSAMAGVIATAPSACTTSARSMPIAAATCRHWPGPATNSAVECALLVRVEDGAFVRHAPEEGFACDEDSVVELTGDFTTAGG